MDQAYALGSIVLIASYDKYSAEVSKYIVTFLLLLVWALTTEESELETGG